MFKSINTFVIAVFFILVLLSQGFCTEQLTITTYYPSPYGSYNELYVTSKLGVGTASPTYDLTVSKTKSGSDLRFQFENLANTAGSNAAAQFSVGGASAGDPYLWFNVASATNWAMGIDNSDSDKFKIASTDSLGTASDRLTIDTSGNVGIGTTTPSYEVEIQATTADLGITATSGNANIWMTTSGGSQAFAIEVETDGDTIFTNRVDTADFLWRAGSGIPTVMVLTESGYLGVGTGSPGSYRIACNGQPGANGYTAWTNYSDRRLKENIKWIEDGTLNKIMQLKPSTFNYNEKYYQVTGYSKDKENRKLCGFVAQEIRDVFPDMVSEKELSGEAYLDTNLTNLQVYLVKAIQEQQREIESLKSELNDLKSKLTK